MFVIGDKGSDASTSHVQWTAESMSSRYDRDEVCYGWSCRLVRVDSSFTGDVARKMAEKLGC